MKWLQADILDRAAMAGIVKDVKADSLIHLAWATGHEFRDSFEENRIWADASISLIDAFAQNGGRRLVFAGSCAEYNWQDSKTGSRNFREQDAPVSPASALGQGKRIVSHYLETAAPVSAATGRIFFCHGAGEKPNRFIPQAIMAALENRQFSMGPGELLRDYMGSRDVAGALCKLLAGTTETTVNICSGEGLTLGEIAASVFLLCDADPALIRHDHRLGGKGVPHRLVGDDTLLRKNIGFVAGDNFVEGLRGSVEWWNSHLK